MAAMKSLAALLLSAFIATFAVAAAPVAAQEKQGRLTGGVKYELPAWFKPSLLDLREEVEEARAKGRHVMLFLHLDECPYCERMLRESFTKGATHDFMRRHFDVISLNVRGALEVTWTDGKRHTESSLARQLKVYGTPTIVFLGADGAIALKTAGYRDPHTLMRALEYVQGGHYRSEPFAAWVRAQEEPPVYALRSHPLFSSRTDLGGHRGPVLVIFEDARCVECPRFHERTLNHPQVLDEMKKLLVVRLDAGSSAAVTTPQGTVTTPAKWAQALGFAARPAFVLYDQGREVFRFDGRLYHFDFKEALRYVSGGHYKRFPTMSQYKAARRAELLGQGIDIDYSD